MWAAGVVIVLALAAAVVGVVLTLELNPWSFAVLPVAIVLGVVALRLQVAADERRAELGAARPRPASRGRHRR